MSAQVHTVSMQSLRTLTAEQAKRVRTALQSVAAERLELGGEELEERIMPGYSSTN